MDMKIEVIPSYCVAYIRNVGPYGAGNMQTMEELKAWTRSNGLFDDQAVLFGIAWDNPEATEPENCRYDTCVVISDEKWIKDDGQVRYGRLAGGSYAVFRISHTAEAVQKAWTEIFPELLKQGRDFDETRPILERYAVSLVKNHECEICVPVK